MKISDDLKPLPIEAMTETWGFLGRKGSGKSNAAGVLVESFLDAEGQVVVLDPVGVWWGLRLRSDGEQQGYEIPILGGPRGDVPLESTAGALIAQLLVEKGLSAVVDLSHFRKTERKRFVTDFAEELFHLKKTNRSPIHLVLEEAQAFIPQFKAKGEERMLGAFEDIVRIGRNYGIGCSMISQRPQSVNKEVLSQVEVLVVFQTVAAQERDAIKKWIVAQGIDVVQLVDTLPSLKTGTAYFWSPAWLRVLKKIRFPLKWSYDASATPKLGEVRRQPRTLDAAEVKGLREAMAETVERAEANDPTALRRQVARLEKELSARHDPAALEQALAREDAAEERLRTVIANIEKWTAHIAPALETVETAFEILTSTLKSPIDVTTATRPAHAPQPQPSVSEPSAELPDEVTAPMAKMLAELASLHQDLGMPSPSRKLVALFCGYSNHRSGGFSEPAHRLQELGYTTAPQPGCMALTRVGRAVAPPGSGCTLDQARSRLITKLGSSMGGMLAVLAEIYPEATEKSVLADQLGYSNIRSGGFSQPIAKLRKLGLVEVQPDRTVRAAPFLFGEDV